MQANEVVLVAIWGGEAAKERKEQKRLEDLYFAVNCFKVLHSRFEVSFFYF